MNKLSTLKLIHIILTDKRNANRYCMTQMRDKKTLEVTATYDDAIQLIEDMIVAEIKESEVEHDA
jgi:hypothetical protein